MRIYATVVFYLLITLGYVWSVVQLIVGEPFDALVLFWVTLYLHTYRSAVRRELREQL